MSGLGLWLRATRIHFLQASILPVAVGSALAHHDGAFSWELFWIMVVAIGAINIGTNLANDYFDHLSGADQRNRHPTPFSGGSRVIQQGLITPDTIFSAAMMAYALAVILGMYLTFRRGWGVLAFGIIGVTLGFFYTAPPLKLGYRGWGELLVGVLLGPLAVMGAYYVQTGAVTASAFFLSLPIGFLVSGILYINQFPDVESDAAAGKLHWVARIGRRRAVRGYAVIIAATYLSIILSVGLRLLPAWILLALVSLPMAVVAARILQQSYDQAQKLVPAMGLTIGTHLVTGLLLLGALLID